ncbi:hypothetical protein FRACA_1180005 [Frankia canadensis]|uniref:Uncharacterized protein n=1 Tax=Frankia canadensis TaxID=1836972 RepID=A0A2I2KJT5_9ACTN|nr:effector-associated domain EAD1-containing protein [Frankia canadensis]SNQ45907.1 hypothetical protein FRACA_1180005 [Frankia canadensis]SOU53197.1 hypothetical protein FRACA_1180005 [Frankia canadensis]
MDHGGYGQQPLSTEQLDALARIFHHPASATWILSRISYPRARQPAWDTAASFWREVSEQLTYGIVFNGPARLLAAAADEYPGNPTFGAPGREQSLTLLDREESRRSLNARLAADRGGLVIVQGEPGVGKTKIVDAVLATAGQARPRRVHRHEALPGIPLDVRTLIDSLRQEIHESDPAMVRGSSTARLEATLLACGDTPVTLVIENAENLTEDPSGKLSDLDLDEAFEIISDGHGRHRVTLILVSRVMLASPQGNRWPQRTHPIIVRGLEPDYFSEYLRKLDMAGRSGLGELSAEAGRELFRLLAGNPRDAELAHGILTSRGFRTSQELIHVLRGLPAGSISHWLVRTYLRTAPPRDREVLRALSAMGTPVDEESIVRLLADIVTAPDIRDSLGQLTISCVTRGSTTGQFFLPPSPLSQHLVAELTRSQSALLADAATELQRMHRERHPVPANVGDLRYRFAALSALLRGDLFEAAYQEIQSIDTAVQPWNRRELLLKSREAIRGRIGTEFHEMANETVLGAIYTFKGKIPEALNSYDRAMAIAVRNGGGTAQLKIKANLAAAYLADHHIERAYQAFLSVHLEAQELNQPLTELHALEGMADCLRRRGRYHEAIRLLDEALHLAARQQHASPRTIQRLAKLARWHAEMGADVRADQWLRLASDLVEPSGSRRSTAIYLDCRADLLLGQQDSAAALDVATEAEEMALHVHDPVILMQARMTLCLGNLVEGRWEKASEHLRQAMWYQPPGRVLIIRALLGLISKHRQEPEEAYEHFHQLDTESRRRIEKETHDFAARDMRCFALCGLDAGPDDITAAVQEFRVARTLTSARTPGLVDRLRFLLTLLNQCSEPPGRLESVLRESNEFAGRGWGA